MQNLKTSSNEVETYRYINPPWQYQSLFCAFFMQFSVELLSVFLSAFLMPF